MHYTLQEQLTYKLKCLCLTSLPSSAYVSDNTQEENTGSIVYKPIYDSLYICSREIVLQRCRQQFPLRFEDCYSAE